MTLGSSDDIGFVATKFLNKKDLLKTFCEFVFISLFEFKYSA
jgi:hypothetical protein